MRLYGALAAEASSASSSASVLPYWGALKASDTAVCVKHTLGRGVKRITFTQ